MEKVQTLAEFLGTVAVAGDGSDRVVLEDIADSKAFALAVLNSREFRNYIVNGLVMSSLPPAVICRLMDHAWGKPPDRIEHTGRDGQPIETVTEVRRVVVHVVQQESCGESVQPVGRVH